MGDTGEDYKAMDQVKRARNQGRREIDTERLKVTGVLFTSHNEGRHLKVIVYNEPLIDYYPGTGKWQSLINPKSKGYGIDGLLEYLGKKDVRP
jgi:hypothetical protein